MKRRTPISRAVLRWRDSLTAVGFARTLFLLVFAVLAHSGVSCAAEHFPSSKPPAVSGLRAPLDDFDGDFRPDQFAVQTGNNEFSGTQYWIELHLSSAGRQLIPVFSLPGGLEVVARDVNGNGSLDLVLTTKSLRRPVAVLLNDGHGRFTRAEADAFPKAFQDAGTSWESRAHSPDDCAELLPSPRLLAVLTAGGSPVAPSSAGRITPANRSIVVSLKATPDSSRAPPLPPFCNFS